MDYIIFIAERDGTSIRHYGTINNVRDLEEAKRKLRNNPNLRGRVFHLVNMKNIVRVNT